MEINVAKYSVYCIQRKNSFYKRVMYEIQNDHAIVINDGTQLTMEKIHRTFYFII